MKKTIIFFSLFFLASLLLYLVLKADYNTAILQKKDPPAKSVFTLKPYLKELPANEIIQKFPEKNYLDSANYQNILFIKADLATLDSANPNESANRQLISTILTNKLFERDSARLSSFNLDTLLLQLQWAEKFKTYAEIDVQNRILYKSISSFWLSYICNRLTSYSSENPSVKYQFKYKYLVARCYELKFTCAVKVESIEKVVDNFTSNKWAHLTSALWDQTSKLQKILFLIFTLLSLYGYYLIILKLLKK